MRFISTILFLLCLSAFAKGETTQHIKISLVDVSVVDAESTRDIDWPTSLPKPIPYTIKNLIKVTFSSAIDLRQFVREEEATLSVSAYICRKEKIFHENGDDIGGPAIDELGVVAGNSELLQKKESLIKKDTKDGSYKYYAFLSTVSHKNFSNDQSTPYNFMKKVEPVCVNIQAEKVWVGKVLDSNVLRIDRRVLRRAFDAKSAGSKQ